MKIINARKTDAPLIARSIMDAVGEEICSGLATNGHSLDDVERLFTSLALREDSQYSYLNTLTALDDSGKAVGVCVGYDGSRLHELREAFFEEAEKQLGIEMGDIDDETDSGEFYIDTLAVLPEYRGRGIASELLRASIRRAEAIGKPAGLLVDKENTRARRLYENIGFRKVGERPFCYVMMDHLHFQGS
ncbi:MAG: GNAT family N-acetyltransferase [Duncaniella sp.]|uniref:GNAT family N-acetyltransferase n=1 Tax=Duncaniella sp. TaxID=2518496 RepID=UPI0019BA99B1|nr:GNAT family N-acetyltransferase [Duncaniella sp.]MBD5334675.1 GNAT family N-acetyltransferase [Bacteroides sp.]MDE6089198.1 GNAT family N-acetyltransferase [Duncaniella sp.]